MKQIVGLKSALNQQAACHAQTTRQSLILRLNGCHRVIRSLIFFAVCLGCVTTTAAQHSFSIIGRESLARNCYESSMQASLSNSANNADLLMCDRALEDGALNSTERAATYSNRGVIYMAMGNVKEAYQDYQKALSIDGELAEAYINRGNLWFAIHRHQRAVDDYHKALKYGTEKRHIAYLNRGLSYEAMGRFELAKADYHSALIAQPDWKIAVQKSARVDAKLNTLKLQSLSPDPSGLKKPDFNNSEYNDSQIKSSETKSPDTKGKNFD